LPLGKRQLYPLDRRLRGPERSESYGEKKEFLPLPGIDPILSGSLDIFSGCEWGRLPPYMQSSCQCVDKQLRTDKKRWFSRGLGGGLTTPPPTVKKNSMLLSVTMGLGLERIVWCRRSRIVWI